MILFTKRERIRTPFIPVSSTDTGLATRSAAERDREGGAQRETTRPVLSSRHHVAVGEGLDGASHQLD